MLVRKGFLNSKEAFFPSFKLLQNPKILFPTPFYPLLQGFNQNFKNYGLAHLRRAGFSSTIEKLDQFKSEIIKNPNKKQIISGNKRTEVKMNFFEITSEIHKNQEPINRTFVEIFQGLTRAEVIESKDFEKFEPLFLLPQTIAKLDPTSTIALYQNFLKLQKGTVEVYDIFARHLIKELEADWYSVRRFMDLIGILTRANAFRDESFKYVSEKLDSLVKSDPQGEFYLHLIGSQICTLSLFFSLNYDRTLHMHSDFLNGIELQMKEQLTQFYQGTQQITQLRDLWSFFMTLQANDPEAFKALQNRNIIQRVPFKYRGEKHATPSSDQILEMIGELYPGKTIQHEKMIGVYRVDGFLEPYTVIEINGRYHYIGNKAERRSGEYEVKYRNLCKLGYDVREIVVHFYQQQRSMQEKIYFLKKELGLLSY